MAQSAAQKAYQQNLAQQNTSSSAAWGNASSVIGKVVQTTLKGVQQEVSSRTYRAANELRNSALYILRGSRGGRIYKVPNTGVTYKASAPGQPPAVRTGAFRLSWGTHVHVEKVGVHFKAVASIESHERAGGYLLGELLENGTSKMAPRPYKQKIKDKALPKIKQIYSAPY